MVKRRLWWLIPIVVVALIIVAFGGVLLIRSSSGATGAAATLDGVWYGSLDITRYAPQTFTPSDQLTEAFYLKLTLKPDDTITGTYATCPTTTPVTWQNLQEYTIASGVIDKATIHLYVFSAMWGTFTGATMTLNGMRYPPHSDFPSDKYASTLHKVSASAYLSACQIV